MTMWLMASCAWTLGTLWYAARARWWAGHYGWNAMLVGAMLAVVLWATAGESHEVIYLCATYLAVQRVVLIEQAQRSVL